MSKAPNKITVELTSRDVKKNLLIVLNDMDRIRNESLADYQANDEQKTNYLRLTGELASCVKALIKENSFEKQFEVIKEAVEKNDLLKNYDPLQEKFWEEQQKGFKEELETLSVKLLGDDFVSTEQHYHFFQAMKYLNSSENDRVNTYYSILPFNSLLKSETINNPVVAQYLMSQLIQDINSDGSGVKGSISQEKLLELMRNAGALYVDMPPSEYNSLRKKFKKTKLLKVEDKKVTRVYFDRDTIKKGVNAFEKLEEHALRDLEDTEKDLEKSIKNFYSYGKEFKKAMLHEMTGIEEIVEEETKEYQRATKEEEQVETKDRKYFIEPTSPKSSYEQNLQEWVSILEKKEKIVASMGDLYSWFKQIKKDIEQGTGLVKEEAVKAKKSINAILRSGYRLAGDTTVDYAGHGGVTILQYSNTKDKNTKKNILDIEEIPKGSTCCLTEKRKYLSAIFNTKDNAETIGEVLSAITGKDAIFHESFNLANTRIPALRIESNFLKIILVGEGNTIKVRSARKDKRNICKKIKR